MKRMFVFFTFVSLFSINVFSQSPDDFILELIKDGNNTSITIIKYKGEETKVFIPNDIRGIPITKIGNNAFMNCGSVKSIKLPDNLIDIGQGAFAFCYELESIVIPSNVKNIGMGAFSQCSNLSKILLPEGLESIREGAFMLTAIDTINIPSTVKIIEKSALEIGYAELKKLTYAGVPISPEELMQKYGSSIFGTWLELRPFKGNNK